MTDPTSLHKVSVGLSLFRHYCWRPGLKNLALQIFGFGVTTSLNLSEMLHELTLVEALAYNGRRAYSTIN